MGGVHNSVDLYPNTDTLLLPGIFFWGQIWAKESKALKVHWVIIVSRMIQQNASTLSTYSIACHLPQDVSRKKSENIGWVSLEGN